MKKCHLVSMCTLPISKSHFKKALFLPFFFARNSIIEWWGIWGHAFSKGLSARIRIWKKYNMKWYICILARIKKSYGIPYFQLTENKLLTISPFLWRHSIKIPQPPRRKMFAIEKNLSYFFSFTPRVCFAITFEQTFVSKK